MTCVREDKGGSEIGLNFTADTFLLELLCSLQMWLQYKYIMLSRVSIHHMVLASAQMSAQAITTLSSAMYLHDGRLPHLQVCMHQYIGIPSVLPTTYTCASVS